MSRSRRSFISFLSFLTGMAFMWVIMQAWGLYRSMEGTTDYISSQTLEEEMPGVAGENFSPLNVFGSDLKDAGDHYELEIETEGMTPQNFSVEVSEGHLIIEGNLQTKEEGFEATSRFHRSFPVPNEIDASRVQLENKDDRVLVILPKKPAL